MHHRNGGGRVRDGGVAQWVQGALTVLLVGLVVGAAGGGGASPLHAQDAASLAGRWSGEITLPTMALQVSADFTAAGDTLDGTIDIPQQNARGLPLAGIRVTADSAVFSIRGVPGDPTFRGAFTAGRDTLAGSFLQGGQTIPFRLVREAPAAEASGAPAPGRRSRWRSTPASTSTRATA